MRPNPLLAVFLLGLPMSVTASNFDNVAMAGAGISSCGQYLEVVSDPAQESIALMFASWTQGFLTALNMSRTSSLPKGGDVSFSTVSTVDISDMHGQERWLQNYCSRNPLDAYAKANIRLWLELIRRQKLTPSG